MTGELLLRTKATINIANVAAADQTGVIHTTDNIDPKFNYSGLNSKKKIYGWTDVFTRYGMSMEDGALSKLLSYKPMKEPTNAKSPTKHGVAYAGNTIGFTNERQFAFDVHFKADTEEEFMSRYLRFVNDILSCQYIQLTTKYSSDIYHLLYIDCQQFSQWNRELAKFTLNFTEPHPEIRTNRYPDIFPSIS